MLAAANNLLGKAQLPPDTQWEVVIDPLIDGVTGTQTQATRAMGTRIVKIIKESFPRYAVQPFNSGNLQRGPLLLVGTFTGVNAERKTEGKRVAYRICLALADLKTGKLVSKGLAFADAEGVDATPLPYFRDAPAWLEDATTQGYIRTCQGTRAGRRDPPAYIDRVLTSATLAEADDAYCRRQVRGGTPSSTRPRAAAPAASSCAPTPGCTSPTGGLATAPRRPTPSARSSTRAWRTSAWA